MENINESFNSKFLTTLSGNLKRNYKEDNEATRNFYQEGTEILKEIWSIGQDDKDLKDKMMDKIHDFTKKWISSPSTRDDIEKDLRHLCGREEASYYNSGNYRDVDFKKYRTYYQLKYVKDRFKSLATKSSFKSFSEYDNPIRKNRTNTSDDEQNSFKAIAHMLGRRGWGGGMTLDTITDDQIKLINKLPKVVTDKSSLAGCFLFWFRSEDPTNEELLNTDVLVGLTHDSYVYLPEAGYKEHYLVKDMTNTLHANKLFALTPKKEQRDDYDKKYAERQSNKTFYRYDLCAAKKSWQTPVEMDELPDPNSPGAPSSVKVGNDIYSREVAGEVLSTDEYKRDVQYQEQIKRQIKRYKTIIQNNKLSREGDKFDKQIEQVVKLVNTYLSTAEFNTASLRTIYKKIDEMLSHFEQYLHYKNYLQAEFDRYYKNSMIDERNKAVEAANWLMQHVKQQ